MSRGPGRIESALEQALRDTDRSFTVEELAMIAFPGINRVNKKHRVSVLRALTNANRRGLLLWQFTTYKPPWRLVIVNLANVRSYAHGLLRVAWWGDVERTLDQIEIILLDDEVRAELLATGGMWWTKAEIAKAEIEFKAHIKAAIAAGIADDINGVLRTRVADAPPEFQDCFKQLSALRYYLNTNFRHEGWQPWVLGKFEPPGSHIYEYAMKVRGDGRVQSENEKVSHFGSV